MKVTINGQEKNIPHSQNLRGVIQNVSPDSSRIIAEINGQIIKSAQWDSQVVQDGDTIELVSFVGGG